MSEKRFERIYADVNVFCRDHNAKGLSQLIEKEDYDTIVDLLNRLADENEQLKMKNKFLQNQYERKDRQLHRTKKDIEKYTDYFMNELNWDCDRIIREVFK